MDNPQRPEDGNSNPGLYVQAADTNTDAEIQTAIDNLQYLMELESNGNASILTSDGSADAREATSAVRNGRDNICSTVHSQGPHFSPSVEESRGLNMLNTSQNRFDPYGMAVNSSDPTHYSNNSASNYKFMNETYPNHRKNKPEIWDKCGEDLSADNQQDTNYDKTLGFNATSRMAFHNKAVASIDGQNIESHYDLSQIDRNYSEPCHISEVVASIAFCYSDRNFAASGSSGCHRDKITPNVVGEVFQSSIKVDIKSMKCKEIKALICRICEDEIVQHEAGKNVFTCVDSLYYNRDGTDLRIHRSTRVPKTTCTICGKEHAVENSHNSEQCPHPECKKTFQYRTRFYQHIPEHTEYFKKLCWVCNRTFEEHITEKDSTTFECCVCGLQSNRLSNIQNHNSLHLPRCFCNFYEKEYHVDDKTFHGNEIKCCVCSCIFMCRIQLEEHFEGHVKYFSKHCKISKSNEKNSFFRCPFDDSFLTLSEVDFKYHLYSRAGLIVFKCETCGRRFPKNKSLNSHFPKCKALPYKCELCETRFLTFDLLHSHGLVKHAG